MWRAIEAIAPSVRVRPTVTDVQDLAEIENAIKAYASEPNGGLIVLPSPITLNNRELVIALAARHRLPAVYAYRFFVSDVGLVSYGADPIDQSKQAAVHVDSILKGAKPEDLPVQQPTKFDLVVNLKTAKAPGLTISPTLLTRADEVIE
jgi:putative ABC transport system substrate-binding protein